MKRTAPVPMRHTVNLIDMSIQVICACEALTVDISRYARVIIAYEFNPDLAIQFTTPIP